MIFHNSSYITKKNKNWGSLKESLQEADFGFKVITGSNNMGKNAGKFSSNNYVNLKHPIVGGKIKFNIELMPVICHHIGK